MSNDHTRDMHTSSMADSLLGPSGDYQQLFTQYHRLIVGTAFRVTGSGEDAEDVLQTVFMRLLKRWDEIDLSSNPGAYLRRAAVNASLDLLRARTRAASVPLDDNAGLMNMTQTAVAVMLHRARNKVRTQLQDFVGGMES